MIITNCLSDEQGSCFVCRAFSRKRFVFHAGSGEYADCKIRHGSGTCLHGADQRQHGKSRNGKTEETEQKKATQTGCIRR